MDFEFACKGTEKLGKSKQYQFNGEGGVTGPDSAAVGEDFDIFVTFITNNEKKYHDSMRD
ncbi:MAG TPA: hypothetical protein PKG48_11120 [Bacteroidales bacterium]|nr:hypothetical protein [Bacteroidales bacterium]HPS61959.1 hypothetical protein [Bacteroidales bacterium]